MTFVALKRTGFNKNRVMGMGGTLDLSRFKSFISEALGVSRGSIHAMVIGEHGENMLPLVRFSSIAGIPLKEFLSEWQSKEIFEKTKNVAAQVISTKGATIHAPGNAIATIAEAVIRDKKSVIPVSTFLEGEYGAHNLCIGVPGVIGSNGVDKIIELNLDEDEKKIFDKGILDVKEAIESIGLK
jgi:malate dehydrogenase